MATLMLTNDETGSAFTLEEGEGWCYLYTLAPWATHGLAVLNIETGEVISVRESVTDFFTLRRSAGWRLPRLPDPL